MEETYKIIDVIVAHIQKARKNNDYLTIMNDGIALLERIPILINYSVSQEAEYRKYEAKMLDDRDDTGKRYTSSYCETKSKATNYYSEWQKAKNFIELMYEMVNLSKKLAGSVDKEFNAYK